MANLGSLSLTAIINKHDVCSVYHSRFPLSRSRGATSVVAGRATRAHAAWPRGAQVPGDALGRARAAANHTHRKKKKPLLIRLALESPPVNSCPVRKLRHTIAVKDYTRLPSRRAMWQGAAVDDLRRDLVRFVQRDATRLYTLL